MSKKSVGFDPFSLPESNATSYPEPYRAENQRRWNRRLGDHAGLTNFGVNVTRIEPGGQSSSRHWHSRQDEFIYVLSGEVILETGRRRRNPARRYVCWLSGRHAQRAPVLEPN